MIDAIQARASARGAVRFVIAGDSGAWPDPTADAIFAQLLRQVAQLDPAPDFFVHLGDFAGPGTPARHEHFLRLVEPLPVPSLCVVGNHDLDDPGGAAAFTGIHGPTDFTFGHGHTRFVAIAAASGGARGPDASSLEFLERSLATAPEPHRVVLMHMPPSLGGHYAPHAYWGFTEGEAEFLMLLDRHRVSLVCCAHGLAFDHHVHRGVRFVMSGGGGSGLCSHFRGICTQGDGHPEDRGALYHAVEIAIGPDGTVSGWVHQAFGAQPRLTF